MNKPNVERDGDWVLSAFRRIIEDGGGSESVGCRIDKLVDTDIKMNMQFAQLLLAAIVRETLTK